MLANIVGCEGLPVDGGRSLETMPSMKWAGQSFVKFGPRTALV